eukprot:CAMPEP_0195295136 /NCGR_PEP_ID=MMETSP0707-20130614/16688_1 /TAXON_ID=33640 /ORGANISM="Asterionellopsis glacialis, Strain CCMP134" /LENGTH=625 /DNA_ID=CAMNT_0040356287 /DNA_START=133 /DNA_END=2010 /DNA_ORIENTATION=+
MAQGSYKITPKEYSDEPFAGANLLAGELEFERWDSQFTEADEIEVELIQGRPYSAFSKVGNSIDGIFHGQDALGNTINLVPGVNDDVFGTLSDIQTNQIFFIKTVDGVQVVEGVAADSFPDELDPIEDNAGANRHLLRSSATPTTNTTVMEPTVENVPRNLQGNIVIDVLVLWTRNAECGQSKKSAGCIVSDTTTQSMESLVNLAIQETNVAYQNSGINVQLRLVHSQIYDSYTEPSSNAFTHSLGSIKTSDTIKSLRETYSADLVHLMIDDSQYCGVANLGPREDLAFSITSYKCATGYYSFGHELAHSMGSKHDRGAMGQCNAGGMNYGYRDRNARFRSIMAYSCRTGQCDNNAGGSCTRVQHFSSASHKYNGNTIGDSENDNASHINSVAAQVANFRTPANQAPTPAPQPNPAPTPPVPAGCQSGNVPLKVTLVTDKFPGDISWEIRRTFDNALIQNGDGYKAKETTFNYECSVTDSAYKFTLRDTGGDGLCCTYSNQGAGKVSLMYGNSYIFRDEAAFSTVFEKDFGSNTRAPPAPTPAQTPAPTPAPARTYCDLGRNGDKCDDDNQCCTGYTCVEKKSGKECKLNWNKTSDNTSIPKNSLLGSGNPWDNRKLRKARRRNA